MKNPYPAYYPFFFALVNVFICFPAYLTISQQTNKSNKNIMITKIHPQKII
jgi:hypothetical protein